MLVRRALSALRPRCGRALSTSSTSNLATDLNAWLDDRGVKRENVRAEDVDDGGRVGFVATKAASAGDTLATLPRGSIFCSATAIESMQNPLSNVMIEVLHGYGDLREANPFGGADRYDAMEVALQLVAERRMPGYTSPWGAWLDAAEASARAQPTGYHDAINDKFFNVFAASVEEDLQPVFDAMAMSPEGQAQAERDAKEPFLDILAVWYSYVTWSGTRLPAVPGALEEGPGLGLSLLPLALGSDGARNAEFRLLDRGEAIESGGFLGVEATGSIAAGAEIVL